MQLRTEINESQLIYRVFNDFGNGETFHTSMYTSIVVEGNFCRNYRLYPKQFVEHVLQNGTRRERLQMMSDLSFDGARFVKNDNDNTEYFIGQNMIGNFDYNLKIVNDDFKSSVRVYEGNPRFIKKEYMFDARAIFENRCLELLGCVAYSDGRMTFDYFRTFA